MDVFLHIPKASGTTIRTIISREYGVGSTFYYEPESGRFPDRDAPEAYLRSHVSQGNVRLITGHMRYGVHRALHEPCRYFTMLRDPIERTLSDYFYAYNDPFHRFREEILNGQMSFAGFLDAEGVSPALATTYFLAGEFEGLYDPLEAGFFNLNNCFVSIGTSERFDESLLVIARDFGWRPPLYLRRNVTRMDDGLREQRRQARAEARESMSHYFASDFVLYRAAEELLSERVRALGPEFQQALSYYRELQDAVARLDTGDVSETYTLDGDDAPLPAAAEQLLDSEPYRWLAEYLRKSPALPTDRASLVGFLEVRSATKVAGWAMDMARSEPIGVTLYDGGWAIASMICDHQRADVAAAGFPSMGCGFNFSVNPPVNDPEQLTVCFGDLPVRLTVTGDARKNGNALAGELGLSGGGENPLFGYTEPQMQRSWEKIIWPFIGDVADFTHTLDLAAGHGRNSQFLLQYAETLAIMDVDASNIEVCRARFTDYPNASFYVGNGYDLQPLLDESLTFIYCLGAMVHFDSDVVRSYLRDTRRVLRPGGRAFYHHSNYTGGNDWRSNPHGRNFMSREMFAHYANKEGLTVVKQDLRNWGNEIGLDCMSIIER